MSTYSASDPCTDALLDFIAGGVPSNPGGESGGNYNAVIGDAKAPDDLSGYTLDQIYGLMADLLAKGRPSTAVGRYQIIRHTLEALQLQCSLPGSTLFTNELQDRLALALLIGRGYPRWWRGEMSDEDFAHGLSCEWASLPDPKAGGKSHYDGVGPNHASTTLEKVYAGLRDARASIAAPAGLTPPAAPAAADPDHSADALNAAELAQIKSTVTPEAMPVPALVPAAAPPAAPLPPPQRPVHTAIAATGIASAVVVSIVWLLALDGVAVPDQVQAAWAVIITALGAGLLHWRPSLAALQKGDH